MNCQQARQQWMLYFDSEGDAELHLRLNDHLAMCPACAEWFSKQSRLESLLAENLRAAAPTPELWQKVLARSGLFKPARSHLRYWLAGVAASIAAVIVVWLLWQGGSAAAADLSKLSAAWHQKVLDGHEPEYRPKPKAQDPDKDVDEYLRNRVKTFKVRCPPRKDAGFEVQGAGMCQLGDHPAVYLTGLIDTTPVSILILPRQSLAAFPHQQEAVRLHNKHQCREGPYQMVLAVIDRNAVLVIGQTDAERLDRVLRAYGTYPDHH
jgi:hypothetical protein